MNQRITLLTASALWLFGVMAPVAYAGKPVEHVNTRINKQAQFHASEQASFNRNPETILASSPNGQTQSVSQIHPATIANDPAGNNGTVKIDGQPFDTHPDNQPHVGCSFQVDFYNYDAGNNYANVVFSAQAPSGTEHQILVDRVYIGQDAASGGTDVDAQPTYNLTNLLSKLTPHPQQGYHIMLTVHADGSQGSDTKHKVFWVQCGQPVGGKGGITDIQPVAKHTAPIFSGILPRTGGVLAAILLPIAGGLLGAMYAYLRQKYLAQA